MILHFERTTVPRRNGGKGAIKCYQHVNMDEQNQPCRFILFFCLCDFVVKWLIIIIGRHLCSSGAKSRKAKLK